MSIPISRHLSLYQPTPTRYVSPWLDESWGTDSRRQIMEKLIGIGPPSPSRWSVVRATVKVAVGAVVRATVGAVVGTAARALSSQTH